MRRGLDAELPAHLLRTFAHDRKPIMADRFWSVLIERKSAAIVPHLQMDTVIQILEGDDDLRRFCVPRGVPQRFLRDPKEVSLGGRVGRARRSQQGKFDRRRSARERTRFCVSSALSLTPRARNSSSILLDCN